MSDVMKTGSDWLMQQLSDKTSFAVTYRRGSATVSVTATLGSSAWESDSPTGGVIERESRDYLIDVDDLTLNGQAVTPRRGDRIEETRGGTTYTYEVIGDADRPPAEYSDRYRTKWRIHTEQIKAPA